MGAPDQPAPPSSEADREALRELFDHWERGDFSAGVTLFDPGVRFSWEEPPSMIEGTGLEQLVTRLRDFLGAWASLRVQPREILPLAGGGSLVVARQYTVGRTSGARTESDMFIAWRFAAGRVTGMHWSFERARALERAGLSE